MKKAFMQNLKKCLTVPTGELGRWTRFLVFQVRIWWHSIHLLQTNRFATQAAALSYFVRRRAGLETFVFAGRRLAARSEIQATVAS